MHPRFETWIPLFFHTKEKYFNKKAGSCVDVARWTVIITSGRPSKAELLAKLVFKHGGEAVYLPLVKVEENPHDVSYLLDAVRWSEAVLFMTGQSAGGWRSC